MDPQPYLRILQLIDTKVSGEGGREGEERKEREGNGGIDFLCT